MDKIKKTKGITLIALVITIIVLLILAGITINLIIGQNGILRQSQNAGGEHEKAEVKEKIELAILDIKSDKLAKRKQMVREDLKELESIGATIESTGIPATGQYNDYYFEIDEYYKVEVIGKVQGEKPAIQAEILTQGIVAEGGTVEIKVTANISKGSITALEATNGAILKEETSTAEKTFTVNANGTYAFKATADNGRSNTASVEVNTIIEIPVISIKDETEEGFTIEVTNNYKEGLITEYKYYIEGQLKQEGTIQKEYVATQLNGGEYKNIYVEAYIGEYNLTSNIATGIVKIGLGTLKVGDYIEYDTGSQGIKTCRVLYEVDSEYGLQIIANDGIDLLKASTGARESYNNAIITLNNKAEAYINTEYAQDARCVGSIPTIDEYGNFVDKDKCTEKTKTLPSGFTKPSSWTSKDSGFYDSDTNYTTDLNQMKENGISINGGIYWLASLSNDVYTNSLGGKYFRLGIRIGSGAGLSSGGMEPIYTVRTDGFTEDVSGDKFRLVPCISLKSDIIKIIGGDGESYSTAYIIGK